MTLNFNRPFLAMITLILWAANVSSGPALSYGGNVDTTMWMLSGSVFECRFEQPIPDYGRAVFNHTAGEDVTFQLETNRNLMAYSKAQISLNPPPWQPSRPSESLGSAAIVKDQPNLSLDAERTNQFLHALLEGKWPTITHKTFYDQDRFVQVHVSAIRFDKYYQDYIRCVNQLLPMNFEQVARSKVHFKIGQSEIDPKDTDMLNRIVFYIKHDPRVFAVYLDGHSDNIGRRYDNRQTSKLRVESVERYFIKQGISPDMITTRFHGDRYPVADNRTAKGRAENRRVTIRLELREDMPIPDDLLFKLPEDATVLPR